MPALRSTLRLLALVAALLAFAAGCSRTVYRSLGEAGLLPDDYRYGDLYRLSSLPQFKAPRETCAKAATGQPRVPADLYVIGDSFLEPGHVDAADFVARRYHYTHWEVPRDTVHLDRSVRNVLILETVERHAREHFAEVPGHLVLSPRPVPPRPKSVPTAWNDLVAFYTGEPDVRQKLPEERLENLLFNSPPVQWLKERKAWFNQVVFGRTNTSIRLSADGQHLLYALDTDSSRIHSNFTPLPEAELRRMVANLNAAAERYRAAGFDAVYVSVIPNKTTLVANDLGTYHRLIERLQTAPDLRVPVIDALGTLRPLGSAAYERGDSHWTCAGRDAWLERVNGLLKAD
jgi:hypothetical protein